MSQSYKFNDVQIGTQSVWGTGVAATARLMGIEDLTITPVVNSIVIPSLNGQLTRGNVAEIVEINGKANINGAVSFEDLPYWFDNIFGQATPSGGGPYTRAYAAPAGTDPTRRILSLYKGYSSTVYRLVGGLVNEFTIKGEVGAPVTFEAALVGAKVEGATLASLSDRDVNYALPHNIDLYIDDFGGAVGTTQITGLTHLTFELKLMPNIALDKGLGSQAATGYHPDTFTGSLSLGLELAATTKAYLDDIIAASATLTKQVRLDIARGTDQIIFDFAGAIIESPNAIDEADGMVSLNLNFEDLKDNTGLGNWFESTIINDVASLV